MDTSEDKKQSNVISPTAQPPTASDKIGVLSIKDQLSLQQYQQNQMQVENKAKEWSEVSYKNGSNGRGHTAPGCGEFAGRGYKENHHLMNLCSSSHNTQNF